MTKFVFRAFMAMVVSIVAMVMGGKMLKRKSEFVKVEAKCINSHRYITHRLRGFENEYQYYYNGRVYTSKGSTLDVTPTPQKGKKCTILINPERPEDIVSNTQILSAYMIIFFGIVFAVCGIVMISNLLGIEIPVFQAI